MAAKFLLVCLAVLVVGTIGSHKNDLTPTLVYRPTCDRYFHKMKYTNDKGCTGETIVLSCTGLCSSYEVSLIATTRFSVDDIPKYLKTTCNCCKPVYNTNEPRIRKININFNCQDQNGNYTEQEQRNVPYITKCQCMAC